jgi:hypothetical protein
MKRVGMRMREIAMEGDDVECEKKEKKKNEFKKRKKSAQP